MRSVPGHFLLFVKEIPVSLGDWAVGVGEVVWLVVVLVVVVVGVRSVDLDVGGK